MKARITLMPSCLKDNIKPLGTLGPIINRPIGAVPDLRSSGNFVGDEANKLIELTRLVVGQTRFDCPGELRSIYTIKSLELQWWFILQLRI